LIAIEIKNLVKSYGSFNAVNNISFEVNRGEIFGLIGPNGAGKTTTLRILATLLQITSGEVKIFGHDLEHEADEVRKIISYLPEDAGAYKNLTGRAYLEFIAPFFGDGNRSSEIVRKGNGFQKPLSCLLDSPCSGLAGLAWMRSSAAFSVHLKILK